MAGANDAADIAHTAAAPMVFVPGSEGLIDARNGILSGDVRDARIVNVPGGGRDPHC